MPVVRTRPDSLRSFAEPVVAGPQPICERISIAGRSCVVRGAVPLGILDQRAFQA